MSNSFRRRDHFPIGDPAVRSVSRHMLSPQTCPSAQPLSQISRTHTGASTLEPVMHGRLLRPMPPSMSDIPAVPSHAPTAMLCKHPDYRVQEWTSQQKATPPHLTFRSWQNANGDMQCRKNALCTLADGHQRSCIEHTVDQGMLSYHPTFIRPDLQPHLTRQTPVIATPTAPYVRFRTWSNSNGELQCRKSAVCTLPDGHQLRCLPKKG